MNGALILSLMLLMLSLDFNSDPIDALLDRADLGVVLCTSSTAARGVVAGGTDFALSGSPVRLAECGFCKDNAKQVNPQERFLSDYHKSQHARLHIDR